MWIIILIYNLLFEGDPLSFLPGRSEVGSDGLPTDAYFQRRSAIYHKGQVQRRYIPTEEIGGAILSYRTQAPVKYIESRKFYCCAYTKAVAETESYQFLQHLCQDGCFTRILSCLEPERIDMNFKRHVWYLDEGPGPYIFTVWGSE